MISIEKLIGDSRQGEATLVKEPKSSNGRKLFLESYGCQMNFSDSEIVASILTQSGFTTTKNEHEADVVLLNTCAIRDNAEQKVRHRLMHLKGIKKKKPDLIVGMLGCMAERLKAQLLEEEKLVDLVAGPDAYRDLPNLIQQVDEGHRAVNVLLSREETYADISPVRLDSNGISAFISIMRGCDNMCSFCVVPFTRGRERSRDANSIVEEAKNLFESGYREITLLGQNVDSYKWKMEDGKWKMEDGKWKVEDGKWKMENGMGKMGDGRSQMGVNFAQLLEMVAQVSPLLRIRFSTSHPKDMTDEVLYTMAKYENICKYIHLPVQSGNSEVLEKMNRGYSREWYLNRINSIRKIMPDCGISTDVIAGFCGETEEQHKETLSLMETVKYDFAYMFKYSERPKTLAERKYKDDISDETKTKRLQEVIGLQQKHSHYRTKLAVGKIHQVLVEGTSKRSEEHFFGRNTQNTVVVFLKKGGIKKGDYVNVLVKGCTPATLMGEIVEEKYF